MTNPVSLSPLPIQCKPILYSVRLVFKATPLVLTAPCPGQVPNVDGGIMHNVATQDGRVNRDTTRGASHDAHTRAGRYLKQSTYAEILQQAKNPDRTNCHQQGQSWADVARRGNVSRTEGQTPLAQTTVPVVSAGEHARDIPGGPPEAASKALADGAGEVGWLRSATAKVVDRVTIMLNSGQGERDKRKHCPEAFLAWVSAPTVFHFLLVSPSSNPLQ